MFVQGYEALKVALGAYFGDQQYGLEVLSGNPFGTKLHPLTGQPRQATAPSWQIYDAGMEGAFSSDAEVLGLQNKAGAP